MFSFDRGVRVAIQRRRAVGRPRYGNATDARSRHVGKEGPPRPSSPRKRPSSSETSCRSSRSATRCCSRAPSRRSTSAARSRVALVEDVDNLSAPVIAIFAQKGSVDRRSRRRRICTGRLRGARAQGAQAQLGNYSLILQGLTRIRLDEVTQTGPYLKAKIARLEEAGRRRRRGRGALDEPARHREAGHPAHAGAAARGGLAHRLDPGAGRARGPRRREPRRAGRGEGAAPRDGRREGAHPQGPPLLTRQLEILKMRERINSQIKEEMGKNQREYVLRQQLKAIKEELGEDDGDQGDLDGLEERIAKASLPHRGRAGREEAAQAPAQHAGGLAPSTPSSARTSTGSSICRGTTQTPDNLDIAAVRKVLDEDHYGLEKVKKRILEYLAVRKLKKDKKGPILCLIGPPGVGKTSLGASIARALGRKFRPHLARRRARRGRDPRSPAHVRRRAARPDHPGDEEGGDDQPRLHDGRGRQDRARLPRRSRGGAPRGARSRAEQHVRGSLPRDPVRPLERDVRRDGEHGRPDPRAAPRPHGDPRDPRLHAAREARHRAAAPHPEAARGARHHARSSSRSPTRRSTSSSTTTRARRASARSSARSRASSAASP